MMRQPVKITVIGSSNTDMVARADHLPRPGETVLGGVFAMVLGGKGANQAVAAARLGAQVTFIARLGADAFGDAALHGLAAEGINTDYVIRDPSTPSGVAVIYVDERTGENSIIVAPGANANLRAPDVEAARDAILSADIVVCQLETPLEAVAYALKLAHQAGVTTLLNPAPAQVLSDEMLRSVSILTPNETELDTLGGDASALCARGVGTVIVTLGGQGACVITLANPAGYHVPGYRVPQAMDTTAAGDCFTGALAVAIGEGMATEEAVSFANAAAALSVTRSGAQPSLPTRQEVDRFRHTKPAPSKSSLVPSK